MMNSFSQRETALPAQFHHGRHFDVFNGDADGLCAIHQWRMAFPAESELITGAKRDISLLQQIAVESGDHICVFDISFDQNAEAAKRLLGQGATITYFDHHSAARSFRHPGLSLYVDEDAKVCTSLLVSQYLSHRYPGWAVAAAYGDNLAESAEALGSAHGFSRSQMAQLCELGKLLNYNAYGESLADLHFHPALLYRELSQFQDPFNFIAQSNAFRTLQRGFHSDCLYLAALLPFESGDSASVYLLPDQSWARRISGEFANRLAVAHPEQSCAVIVPRAGSSLVVSVRSSDPEARPAGKFCERFALGGGRRSAGGVNALPLAELDHFVLQFLQYFSVSAA